MEYKGVNELRKMFLEFFESKQHLRGASSSLVPKNDNSLLLINSGMAPLKPYFTGQEEPPRTRMTTCQKCIRTGDIENVGITDRHGTFFEMLGNFSFGDYFKKEAISWAWEFITKVLEIPEDRLFVSVYEDDEEARTIWHEQEKVPYERIVKMGKEDNYWEHGLGPCGPCSEIYYDRGEEYGCNEEGCTVGCECDRYMEVWNLVFTQFEKLENGDYAELKQKNIDTGMGLERLAIVMQNAENFFDIDTMRAIRDSVCKKAGIKYGLDKQKDVSIRVIMDHIRSVTFMTSDGIMPSNEGRGYVLRRLLRRAVRHGRILGIEGKFINDLAKVVIETSHDGYPELKEKEAYILKVLSHEEDSFNETIDQGIEILNDYLKEVENGELSGAKAFKLYDTYGFPLDLTREIAQEANIKVNEEDFNKEMEAQRNRARAARGESTYMGADETVYNKLPISVGGIFDGYKEINLESKVTAITNDKEIIQVAKAGDKISIFTEKTPFYATSGGQQADKGYIVSDNVKIKIEDVSKVVGKNIAHLGIIESGEVKVGESVTLKVSKNDRFSAARNHSATHLLQKALKTVLGDHIEQAGSSVNADRLRFDFTHFEAISKDDLEKVEKIVNESIQAAYTVNVKEMEIEEAKKLGAMALFGEKYGDTVRVVNMGDYSIELCAGTHVSNTSDIGLFKLVSEGGVASGVRRIEALTGNGAINYYKEVEEKLLDACKILKTDANNFNHKIEQMLEEIKELKAENDSLKSSQASGMVDEILNTAIEINGTSLITTAVKDFGKDELRDLGDKLKDAKEDVAIVLASDNNGKVLLLTMADQKAMAKGAHAGNLIKAIATVVGGGGGGRPNMAQAGGKDATKLSLAFEKAKEVVAAQIN